MLDLSIEPELTQQAIQPIVEGVAGRLYDRVARDPERLLALLLLALSHCHATILRIHYPRRHPPDGRLLPRAASHETSAETPVSALQKWLLFSRQSLASERFVRGDEEADEFCETASCVARGAMNPAMVGFRMMRECTR
jgi:hypothetical protein